MQQPRACRRKQIEAHAGDSNTTGKHACIQSCFLRQSTCSMSAHCSAANKQGHSIAHSSSTRIRPCRHKHSRHSPSTAQPCRSQQASKQASISQQQLHHQPLATTACNDTQYPSPPRPITPAPSVVRPLSFVVSVFSQGHFMQPPSVSMQQLSYECWQSSCSGLEAQCSCSTPA
jgi:hypothetical protein